MANTGNVFAGTGTTVARGTNTDWTNPGNIVSDNTTDATCSSGATGSDYLRASNFAFSLPAGSTINGITVRVEASEHTSGTESLNVQLVNDTGALIGSSKAATISGTAKVVYTYGSTSDVWGASLTEAIVEDIDFGVQCWFTTTHDVRVDYITIAIEYTSIVDLPQTHADSLNNWGDLLAFQLLGFQTFDASDSLNNWLDDFAIRLSYLSVFSDSLSLSDNLNIGIGLANFDTLVLSDSNLINLHYLISFNDDLNNFNDASNFQLLGFYELVFADNLLNLNDTFALIYAYLINFTDANATISDSSEIQLIASGGSGDTINNLNTIMLDCTIGID